MSNAVKSKKQTQSKTSGYFKNRLPYMHWGNKPRILVVFDGLSFENKPPSNMMQRYFKRITKEYTVYLVGRKPYLPLGYSINDMSEDYATMIKEEFDEPVDIMGISSGGPIAQYFAVNHPDLTQRLVLAITGYTLSENGKKLQLKVGELARAGKWTKAYSTLMDGVHPSGGIKKHFLKLFMWVYATFSKPADPSDLLVTIEAEDKHNFKNQLADIKVPTLVIGGEEDYFYLIPETAQGIPNAKLILYKKSGHNVMFDNSRQFQEDILEFLNEGTSGAQAHSQKN